MSSPNISQDNLSFVEQLYQKWRQDPEHVPDQWKIFFGSLVESSVKEQRNNANSPFPTDGLATSYRSTDTGHTANEALGASERLPSLDASDYPDGLDDPDDVISNQTSNKQELVNRLIRAYRNSGYLYANLNPLGDYSTPGLRYLRAIVEGHLHDLSRIESFGLSESDMDTEFYTGGHFEPSRMSLRDLTAKLRSVYCSTLGIEFQHIQNRSIRNWLTTKIEDPRCARDWNNSQKIRFQKDLIKAEELEVFIHSNFIGQKRFSLEGGEALIPSLRYLIDNAADNHLQEIVLGMAHRGRLNVFTNALRKPAVDTFAHFIDNYQAHTYGGSGDVKYHLGHSFDVTASSGQKIHISLVANPSHLEAVGPVVEGKCRGIQRRRNDRNRKKVMPVLIHGDAAFAGQGVVIETFNLSQLHGYRTGGTVHIIVNNQIGFTTASRDSRSTPFVTDIAKSMSIPIFHANGDDPESVVRATDLAMRYRQKFGHDVVVDIICFRKLGHNEADEPSFTHPIMYARIKEHPGVRALYGKRLDSEGIYSQSDQAVFRDCYINVLNEELQKAKQAPHVPVSDALTDGDWAGKSRNYSFEVVDTSVPPEKLRAIADSLLAIPDDLNVHAKLKRILDSRRKQIDSGNNIDWAFAESLAFGSLLLERYAIRLSGEDCSRATFSQRHAIWWDPTATIPRQYCPFLNLSKDQAWFSVYDSPLSEFSVLGFDYGYSLAQPNILVMWEAQFGDFVNGAQVIIDQFIAAAESKWERFSGLTLLLPHGYEGQGPEHSSAHLERFLQLCAEENMQVVNPTTPAQYFHLLRKQMKQSFRKPLIVMTPKSLLRHSRCVSSRDEFSDGRFRMVIDDTLPGENIVRLLLCSGKIYYDLLEYREKHNIDNVAIVRIEQLYPFPKDSIKAILSKYTVESSVIWCQEESKNRGAWQFIHTLLDELLWSSGRTCRCFSRAATPSPAIGSYQQHVAEKEEIIKSAFGDIKVAFHSQVFSRESI